MLAAALALVGGVGTAFEAALLGMSRSRLEDLLDEEEARSGRPAGRFLRAMVAGDAGVRLGAAIWSVLGTASFVLLGVLVWVAPAMEEGGVGLRAGALLAAAVLLRSAASRLGEAGGERFVLAVARPAWILTWPLRPLTRLLIGLEHVLVLSMGRTPVKSEDDREEEVIAAVSDGELDGVVQEEQRAMIKSIFDLKDADVSDILTPRTEMVSISAELSLAEAIDVAIEKGHSRLPVHEETRDNIIGIFYVKEALRYWGNGTTEIPDLREVLRPPLFVPETKRLPELLQEMRRGQTHLAVVLDEYGGTAGLVTIEDVLEEIVGEIQDEYDTEPPSTGFQLVDPETLVAEAWVHVSDVNEAFEEDLLPEDADFETVGGFVLSELGHIPKSGEMLETENLRIQVLAADERKILRLKIRRVPTDET